MNAMNEEIDQIKKNNACTLVPRPKENNVIRTKWIFENKLKEKGEVGRNKVRLVIIKVIPKKKALIMVRPLHPYLDWKE